MHILWEIESHGWPSVLLGSQKESLNINQVVAIILGCCEGTNSKLLQRFAGRWQVLRPPRLCTICSLVCFSEYSQRQKVNTCRLGLKTFSLFIWLHLCWGSGYQDNVMRPLLPFPQKKEGITYQCLHLLSDVSLSTAECVSNVWWWLTVFISRLSRVGLQNWLASMSILELTVQTSSPTPLMAASTAFQFFAK